MKKSTKGVLLSGIVFPGLGQLALGRKGTGFLFILLTGAGLTGLLYSALNQIPLVMGRLLPEFTSGTLNLAKIIQVSRQISNTGDFQLGSLSSIFIVGCWVAATLHALVVGMELDKKG